jgi:hypothetical protein
VVLKNPQEQKQWVHLNAFLAYLTSQISDPHEFSPFNFARNAIWAFKDTLEGDKELLPYHIETANAWFNNAGSQMQKWSSERAEWPNEEATPGIAYSEKDWKGFTEERLDIWKYKIGWTD